MTATLPGIERQVAVLVAVDHCSAGCVGIHAAIRGTRFEALQPIRQGVRECFGAVGKDVAECLNNPRALQHPLHSHQLAWRTSDNHPVSNCFSIYAI